MKTSIIIICAVLLVGCKSSQSSAQLDEPQAQTRALRLANDKAYELFQRRPFQDGNAAKFESGHWVWKELTRGDFEAEVEMAPDGSTNSVTVNWLVDQALP